MNDPGQLFINLTNYIVDRSPELDLKVGKTAVHGSTYGCYLYPKLFHRPAIILDEDHYYSRGIDLVFTVAHEYGHHLDFLDRGKRLDRSSRRALRALSRHRKDKNKPLPRSADFVGVMRAEVAAWMHGQRVLKLLGFTDWPDFQRVTVWSLRTYENVYTMCRNAEGKQV